MTAAGRATSWDEGVFVPDAPRSARDQPPPPPPTWLPHRRERLPQREAPPPHAPRPAPDWSGRPVGATLGADEVLRPGPDRPDPGWRRVLFDLTGWSPGPGAAAAVRAERHARIARPVRGCRRVAVLSVKGGVGKTTVAAMLAHTFADRRGDRVLAVDANPDLGTLADRLCGGAEVGLQHLLDFLTDRQAFSIPDLERFLSSVGRLRVLAGSLEPCHGTAFTAVEYEDAIAALSSCFNVVVIDTGTGLGHASLAGVLGTADAVVLVAEPTVDAASRAAMTLEWLAGSGHGALAERAVLAVCRDRASAAIDDDAVRAHFARRCAAVVDVPADAHLLTGARIDPAACGRGTGLAFEALAAAVADTFDGGV